MRFRFHTIGFSAFFAATTAFASGVSPYLPLHLSPEIERDVERVLILGDKPTLTRPIPAARVLEALPAACKHDQRLCERVRAFLDRYMKKSNPTYASIEISNAHNVNPAIPNGHGVDPNSPWNFNAGGYLQINDYFLVNAGVVTDRESTTATGSFVSLGNEYAQLDVGYRDHWFSPMTDSSMLIGTQAATMPSITLSNYTPIAGLGVQYEIFYAKMSKSDNIDVGVDQNGNPCTKTNQKDCLTQGSPQLAGLHLAIEPTAGWSLAANRQVQYGGGSLGKTGFRGFRDAITLTHGDLAIVTPENPTGEFGNQQASWTSRMIFPGRVPFAIYFEYAGEDTSYSGNYRLGNSALSGGIDIPRLWDNFNFTYEVSEWQNGWYVHQTYLDGMTNHGHVLGSWFGDDRKFNDGVGGQSHMVRLGWEPDFGGVAEFRYRTLANATYSGVEYFRAHDFTLRYSYPWRDMLVGGEINAGRDVFDDRYSRISAFARFGGNYSDRGTTDTNEEEVADDSVDYFVDAGGSASRMRIELSDGFPKYITGFSYAPHVGLGARRVVSEKSDLGARIEFDNIDDHLLIAVRALDYRHRWGNHFAFTAFAGAARYNLATPAFGYYGGLGAQWRNIMKKMDLNLDFRYGDKIARDKFPAISSDPPVVVGRDRPDEFYDLMGATLYLSYRL